MQQLLTKFYSQSIILLAFYLSSFVTVGYV